MTRRFLWIAAVAALAVGPLVLPEFYLTLLNVIGISALVVLGLVLLTGIAGLTSFGQAAFVGTAAYISAYGTTELGLSPWLTLLIGVSATALLALALGASPVIICQSRRLHGERRSSSCLPVFRCWVVRLG